LVTNATFVVSNPGDGHSTRGAPIANVEDDLVISEREHSKTGLPPSFESTHPVGIQLHQQKATTIDENSGVRVLLLKEPAVLHHDVQVFPLHFGLPFSQGEAASPRERIPPRFPGDEQ
jgi:hypothetical protein